MNDQSQAKAAREYGELFYRADAVAAILRMVAELLEDVQRRAVLDLSHNLPTTMPWTSDRTSPESALDELAVCRPVQFGLQHDIVFGGATVRLAALLRNGPSPVGETDREPAASVADGQSDAQR